MTSYAERKFGVHMFYALYNYLEVSKIIEAFEVGHAFDMFDMCFYLNHLRVLIDYDGGYYHPQERLVRDRQKCLDALSENPNSIVIRVRIKAIPLKIDDDRVLVVEVNTDRIETAVYQVAQLLFRRVPDPWRHNLCKIHDQKRPVCDDCYVDVLKTIDRTFQQEIRILESILASPQVTKLVDTSGMKTGLRFGKISFHIKKLHTRGIRGDKLVTFMCGGVASALVKSPVAFCKGIKTLDAGGVRGDKLVTFMCNGVASALVKSPDELFKIMQTLSEAGFTLDKIITLCQATKQIKCCLYEVLQIGPLITRAEFRAIGRKRKKQRVQGLNTAG